MSGNQKAALGVAVLILAVCIAVAVSMASAPHYVQLYGNLTGEDASQVVTKLKEMRVPYRLVNNGSTIEVPEDKATETRLALASEGIPQGGNVGFELFDTTQIGQSVFGERLNYLRALQGDLSRTIGQLQSVNTARVHLALPERNLYSTEEKKPTASVVLGLRSTAPTPGEIKSIVHLVSSAVEGLSPADVTVVDTKGNLLSEMLDMANNGGTRMQAQRTIAAQMEDRVQSMLNQVLGPGKSIVRANVTLNFNKKQVERETFAPGTENKGVLASQHKSEESYNGAKPGTGSPAGGAVGAVPNTTPGMTVVRQPATGTYMRSEDTSEYAVSKEVIREEVVPGQIERINLALFVDEGIADEQLASVKTTVAAAVGIDAARGDVIAVEPMAFDTSVAKAEEKQAKAAARTNLYYTLGKYGAAGLLAVVFLLFVFSLYRSALAPVTAQVRPRGTIIEGEDESLPLGENVAAAAIEQYQANSALPAGEDEPKAEEFDLNSLDPQRVAQVIKGLMAEE